MNLMRPFLPFAAVFFASFIHAEPASVPRRRASDGVLPFGINFGENLHIIVPVLCIFVVAPAIALIWITGTDMSAKKQKVRDEYFELNGGNLLRSTRAGRQLTVYKADEMESITNCFRSEFPKLGSYCRCFYRGTLPGEGGRQVLVVEVERVPRHQLKQFVNQLIFLSQVLHMNVVRVIGCCLEKRTPLIVYELHGEGACRPLSECTRGDGEGPSPLRAAIGVARGLAYLSPQKLFRSNFVHGDICTATIIVDDSGNAKIFYAVGSNLIPRVRNENDVYRDPELVRPGTKVSTKSDVYSFGVVLLELFLAGERTALSLDECVDLAKAGRLRDHITSEPAAHLENVMTREVAAMAEKCLNERLRKRPIMKKVEGRLSKLSSMPT